MSSGLIDIQIIGDSRDVARRLMGMDRAFQADRMAAWLVTGVDPLLRQNTDRNFGSESFDGEPWQSLKPYTVSERERHGFPGEHPINVRTGQMKRHLLDDPPRIAVQTLGATLWSPGDEGSGTTAKKVKIAQMGGTTPEGHHVPARPVLGVGPEDLEAVLISLAIHIASHQSGVGGNARHIPVGFE